MNQSKLNNVYNESDKNNFVVMYNNSTKEKKEGRHKFEHMSNWTNTNGIVEYTDDVSEQVRALYEKIAMNLEEYFQGKNNINDINNKLRLYYNTVKNYCINTGLISENNEAYKSKILKDIYRNYRYNTVLVAVNVNEIEGKNLAAEIFHQDSNSDNYYVYYNSDYYYECEKLRGTLTDMVKRLAAEDRIYSFDTESIDKRKRYVYDYGFNYAWLWNNKMNIENRVDINKSLVPPEHMKIFYKENTNTPKDGKLVIHCEEERLELDIKFEQAENEKCNLLDIVKSNNFPIINNIELREFLNSFYIYEQDLNSKSSV